MARVVEWDDIDQNQSGTVSVSTTSVQLVPSRLGLHRRTQLIITNTSPTTVTIVKGGADAVANIGIRLMQNQTYIESDDGGFRCWQGAIQAIASASSTVVFMETIERAR
jgi:hypothetical protein